jgi:hypothetical protein
MSLRRVAFALSSVTALAFAARMRPSPSPECGTPASLRRNLDLRETTIRRLLPQSAFLNPPSAFLTDSVIRSDFVVNDDQTGGCTHQAPKLAFDSLGNCVIVWEDYRNGNADPIAQYYDYNGNRVGPTFRPCDDGDMWWHGEPAVGMARGGDYLVVWEDRRHANSDVTAQRYVGDTPIDTNFVINEPSGSDQRGATVTVRRDNSAVVAWEDWRRNNGAIYAQVLDAQGNKVGPNIWVNSSGTWQAYGASIGSDSAGNFALAWEDARAGWDVWCQRYDAQANPLGGNYRVNNIPNTVIALPTPSLAMHGDGSFVVVWSDYRDDTSNANIYCQLFSANGDTLGTNFRVNDFIAGKYHHSARVTCDAQGDFFVTWTDNRDGRDNIYCQMFNSQGLRLGNNLRLNDNAALTNCGGSFVAFSPRNEFWTVWTDNREGRSNIYCQRLSADRNPIGANFRVNDDSFGSHQRVPSIVANEAGRNLTIWEDERNGNCDIYCQFADNNGSQLGPNIKVNTDNVGAAHYYSTCAMDFAGSSITAWTDGRNGTNIYAQAFDASGNRSGGNFKVNANGGDVGHWSPAAAKDSAGNSVIVFCDMRDGPYRIYGQRYDSQNQPVGGNFAVGDTLGGWQQYPSVSMSRRGGFVAAWMDQAENSSVRAQVFDSTGNPVGGNFRVSDAVTNYQGYPGVACDAQGNFAVVWEEWRESTHVDVIGQRFSRDGTRLGSNFVVNQDLTESDAYCPSGCYDPRGRLIVVWSDWRDPRRNPDVYVQRYLADGSAFGPNRIVHEPNQFYYQHHWTMQRSVAASTDHLFFAWTDNRRHRGWDQVNKVTDWNLVGVAENRPAEERLTLSVTPTVATAGSHVRLNVATAAPSPVRTDLFDASGRRIRSLHAPTLPAVPAGTYFVVARTRESQAVAKVVIEESH